MTHALFIMEGILPPSQFNLRASDLSSEWRRWKRAFTDYLLAITLVDTSDAAERCKLALFRDVGVRMYGNSIARWSLWV